MYLYLYAPFLRSRKYSRGLAFFEGRITDFGITGKVAQLSQFLKFPAAVKEFGMRRLTTLVVVGDDALLDEAVNSFALSKVVIGYIPMTESVYGNALSIPHGVEAANTLAARRIVQLDVGRVANRFFLGKLKLEGRNIEVHTPTFSIFPKGHCAVEVYNLREGEDYPTDGKLDIRIIPFEGAFFKKPGAVTAIRAQSCRLKSARPLLIEGGGAGKLKTPLQVDIVPGAIRIIVGSRFKSTEARSTNRGPYRAKKGVKREDR